MIHSALAMPWVVPVIFGCLVGMVAIVANAIVSIMRANAETNLKRRMVEHGYTAEDIARVIRASSHATPDSVDEDANAASRHPSKPPKQYKMTV